MAIRHGTSPTSLDKRDYSYHGTFRKYGAVGAPVFADIFSVDIGKTMQDQNAEGFPFGCTGYTQSDNKGDEDDSIYRPDYTYLKTCQMEGHPPDQGCDIRASLKSTVVYGTQRIDETTDQEAEQHRGGPIFNVYDDGGLDWFDGIRIAVSGRGKGASMGTPWFPSWEHLGADGIVPMPTEDELYKASTDPDSLAWHNYSCKGWTTISGKPYLRIKSWQGKNYGDHGWCYMSRELVNKIIEIRGSVVFIQGHPDGNINTIKLGILEQILVFLYRILGIKRLN
jgi:hypothetical protein